MKVNIIQAKARFSKLLDMVERGEEVEITRDGVVVAKLAPADTVRVRLGGMKGEFTYKEGWERAMTDHEVDDFLAGRY